MLNSYMSVLAITYGSTIMADTDGNVPATILVVMVSDYMMAVTVNDDSNQTRQVVTGADHIHSLAKPHMWGRGVVPQAQITW